MVVLVLTRAAWSLQVLCTEAGLRGRCLRYKPATVCPAVLLPNTEVPKEKPEAWSPAAALPCCC
eukprot:355173-Chlamydomonas_euryale.AAC.4